MLASATIVPIMANLTVAERLGPGNYGRISRVTGICKHHVSRVCRGLREPSFDVASIISTAAGVTLDEFRDHTWSLRDHRVADPDYDKAKVEDEEEDFVPMTGPARTPVEYD